MATQGDADPRTDAGPETTRRILCVADERPWPERSGYRMRLANVLRGLALAGVVDLLVLHGDASTASGEQLGVPAGEPVRSIRVASLPAPVRTATGIWPWLRGDRPRRVAWRDWSAARAALTAAAADEYDLVWWSHLDTWIALGSDVSIPGIVDLDNLEDRWLEGRRHLRRGGGAKARLHAAVADRLDAIDARRWRRWQTRAATTAAAAIVCTEPDRADVGPGRVEIVPNGYATPAAPVGHPERPVPERGGVIAFVGLQTYEPNVDGARFLAQEVLPHLRLRRPEVELQLIGRAGSAVAALETPGVRVLGEVDDLGGALAAADVVAVPIRFGGGTRIKVLEAMAQRIPIVTTTVGCEGLGLRDGVEAVIADEPVAFAAACADLLDDPARRVALVDAAARAHAAVYDWAAIGERVAAIATRAMGERT